MVFLVSVYTPEDLLNLYNQLGGLVQRHRRMVGEAYGSAHLKKQCREHGPCVRLLALRMLRFRLVEDGPSSVLKYGTWKMGELRRPLKGLGGRSIYEAYRRAVEENFNHKFSAVIRILRQELFDKAIVFHGVR